MRFLQNLLVLLAMSSPIVLLAAEDPKSCALNRVASLDLVGDPGHSLVVSVTIQGSPALMLVNTAYAFSTITDTAAARFSLQTRELPRGIDVNAGKKRLEKMATANGFSLGNINFKSADFLVVSNDTMGYYVGALGMDVFAHFDIEIDMAARKLNLYSQDHCPGKVVYWAKTYDAVPFRLGKLGEFYFPMELDGKKIEATLSSGNPVTTLNTDVTRRLFNFDDTSPGVESETDGAGRTIAHYRAMQLSAEGLSVVNANVRLIQRSGATCRISSRFGSTGYEDECMGIHPLNLGLNVLKKLHIYIATKEKVLYFTPAIIADQP